MSRMRFLLWCLGDLVVSLFRETWYIFFAVLLLSLGSCGMPDQRESIRPRHFFDSNLLPYLEEFEQDALRFGIEVDRSSPNDLRLLKWHDDVPSFGGSNRVVGVCIFMYGKVTPIMDRSREFVWAEVYIDSSLKDKEAIILKQLVYHELGHCLLNREHVDDPSQIMNPTISLNVKDLAIRWDSMVEDLFKGQ